MKNKSLTKQIKDSMQPGKVACYKTPEGTIFRVYVPSEEEFNHRVSIAKKLSAKPKEIRNGGGYTQKLLKELIDNQELYYLCLDIEYLQKTYGHSVAECMKILKKKELPCGVSYTFNSIYLIKDWYYYNKSLAQYVGVCELLPLKYRKRWEI